MLIFLLSRVFARDPFEYDPSPVASSGNTLPNPLGITNINDLLHTVFQALTVLAVPAVSAMVLWGAFYIIISGGEPAKLKKGKDIIVWAVVGFGLLLLADGAVAILQSLLS